MGHKDRQKVVMVAVVWTIDIFVQFSREINSVLRENTFLRDETLSSARSINRDFMERKAAGIINQSLLLSKIYCILCGDLERGKALQNCFSCTTTLNSIEQKRAKLQENNFKEKYQWRISKYLIFCLISMLEEFCILIRKWRTTQI